MLDMATPPLPYFAPFEIVIHNRPDDCWVSFLGKVYDITPLINRYKDDACVNPLLAMAGKDITHWFDEKTGDIQHFIHPTTGCRVPYCPYGPIPDVPAQVPASAWRPLNGLPWWKDKRYQIGLSTKRVRPLRIINMLTPFTNDIIINVCCEDTFNRILHRYLPFNSDAESYKWRYIDKDIDMNKTLDENGILDERDVFTELGLPQNIYVPSVLLYYDDDLKYQDFDDDDCEEIE